MSEDTQQEKAQPAKQKLSWKKIVLRTLKWGLIIVAIVFGLLTVLSRLGGNSDVLRQAIEDFMSDATPYSAHISKLNNMNFFPDIIVDVEGIELRAGPDGMGEGVVRVQSAKFVLSFFDVMFKTGRFKEVNIQNLSAAPGAMLAKGVKISSIAIKDEEGHAFVEMTGQIGKNDLNAQIDVSVKGDSSRRSYKLGDDSQFSVQLAEAALSGVFKRSTHGVQFENIELSVGETKALRGNFHLKGKGQGRFSFKGQGRVEPGKTQFNPDMLIDMSEERTKISGSIKSELILVEDLASAAPFMKAINKIDTVFSAESKGGLDFSATELNLDLDLQNIKSGELMLGALKMPVTLAEGDLRIGPLTGALSNGLISGDVFLKTSQSPARLETKIMVKGFDYAALQRQVAETAEIEGTADILVDVKSQGTTMDILINGLSGKVGLVGGQGRMRSELLNIWGGGLLNALLPKFEETSDLQVNCAVVNLDIKDLKGHSDSVFVDTQRVTLHGKGTYDFKTGDLEMVLEPKPKDISIGDISSAVNISGPLSDLSVSPNVFDLSKKVGGLLLGAVNPVFYAVTLADLGLNDNHPCKAFVIEKEVLPPPEVQSDPPVEVESEAGIQQQSTPNE